MTRAYAIASSAVRLPFSDLGKVARRSIAVSGRYQNDVSVSGTPDYETACLLKEDAT